MLISVDAEGIAGVGHPAETDQERYDYERGRRPMTAVNAVVEGVIDAGPATELLVAGSHGPYCIILPGNLDRRARLPRRPGRAPVVPAGWIAAPWR